MLAGLLENLLPNFPAGRWRNASRGLRALIALERACKLRQGDVLIELIDRHGMRAIDIARVTGRRPNDLSRLYNTAKMFPPSVRRPEVPYNGYFLSQCG